MPSHYTRGFFILDKTWIHDNGFFQSLSHAEFRIMMYLLSSVLKTTRRDRLYKRGDQIVLLYQNNHLLVANVSTRTISDRCPVSRRKVCNGIEKFYEHGAAIRIPGGNDPGENNIYNKMLDCSVKDRRWPTEEARGGSLREPINK